MGLWSRRHWDLLQNYMEAFPEEAYDLEFNSQMIAYLSENYLEHQKDWLNTLEIVFEGDAQKLVIGRSFEGYRDTGAAFFW